MRSRKNPFQSDEIGFYYLHFQASRRNENSFYRISVFEMKTNSKLLTFPELSDLTGLPIVHANPGQTMIKYAYGLSRIVFSKACL